MAARALADRVELEPLTQADFVRILTEPESALIKQYTALLRTEGVTLVGASYGGLVSQLYARQHPDQVGGVVLVDSIHPDLDERIEVILPPAYAEERRTERDHR